MHKSQATDWFVVEGATLSFPELWEPTQVKGQGEYKYRAVLLVPETVAKVIMQTAQTLAQTAFRNNEFGRPNFLWPVIPAQNKNAYKDDPRFAGMFSVSVSAKSDHMPKYVERDINGIHEVMDRGKFYAGCKVAASIRLYSFENMSVGIGCGFNALMKTGDGEPLGGGGVDVDAAFANVQTEAPAAPVAGGNGAAPAGMRMPWE